MPAGGSAACETDNCRHVLGLVGFVFGLLSLAVCGVPACSKSAAQTTAATQSGGAPVPIAVALAQRQDVPVQLRVIGRVEAYQTVTVKPQVAGQVRAVHFAEGQEVKVGDLLISLDARPFEAALRRAEAISAKDTALAEDAEREARWTAELMKQTVAAQREYEKAQAAADALKATVQADQASVEQARIDLEYCSIRSQLDGRTGQRLADPGTVVKINEALLVTINQINPIYVTFSVPEQHLSRIKQYQAAGSLAVSAVIPQDAGPAERGVLSFIDNKVDATTGMITLKGTFSNESRRLWPGQFVNVVLTLTTQTDAIVVPSQAVQVGQAGQFVYVVKDDLTADYRPVVTGPTLDAQTVIERGVDAGERVITDGQLRVVRGAKVSIKEASATSQEARR